MPKVCSKDSSTYSGAKPVVESVALRSMGFGYRRPSSLGPGEQEIPDRRNRLLHKVDRGRTTLSYSGRGCQALPLEKRHH